MLDTSLRRRFCTPRTRRLGTRTTPSRYGTSQMANRVFGTGRYGSPWTSSSKYSFVLNGPTTLSTSPRTASTESPCQMQIPVVWSGVAAWIGNWTVAGNPCSNALSSAA